MLMRRSQQPKQMKLNQHLWMVEKLTKILQTSLGALILAEDLQVEVSMALKIYKMMKNGSIVFSYQIFHRSKIKISFMWNLKLSLEPTLALPLQKKVTKLKDTAFGVNLGKMISSNLQPQMGQNIYLEEQKMKLKKDKKKKLNDSKAIQNIQIQLKNSLLKFIITYMKFVYVIVALLFLGASSLRFEHLRASPLHLDQADTPAINWKNVAIDQLNDGEKNLDHVIKSLDKKLTNYNLAQVKINGDSLKNFIYNYVNAQNKTSSIKGTVIDNTIKFNTPEGLQVTYKDIKKKNTTGQQYEVKSVSEVFNNKDSDQNSFSYSNGFTSVTLIS